MRRPQHNTTSLPRQLRDELGLKDPYDDRKRKRSGPASRKEQRQAERSGKRRRGAVNKGRQDSEIDDDDDDTGDGNAGFDMSDDEEAMNIPPSKSTSTDTKKTQQKPKSILKTPKQINGRDLEEDEGEDDENDRTSSRKISDTVKDRLAHDDAEIAALEKKLGLKKGKKLPRSFADEGLDEILGDLNEGSEDEGRKHRSEADEWLRQKRRKAQGLRSENEAEDDSDDYGSDNDGFDGLESEDDSEHEGEDGDFEGFEEEEELPPKKRENPYVAPVSHSDDQKRNKYTPPSLRGVSGSESESLNRLRRQAQGQLNKLSEANLVSILAEIEKLYREYPRQNVTSTLFTLLLGLICERSALQDTFIILHAGFIAAIYKVVGMDFGAELVQKIVERLDAGGDERGKFEGKESINLISLLSQLYNFHVVGSTLVFDYIRIFLQDITETNTELLLKVIKNSGPQLRQDDPSSLKDIVLLIQPAIAKVGEAALSVRTKFMIDTITDLKNNRVKAGGVGFSIASEHIAKMRKILGSINSTRVIRASEPIRVSRADIQNSSKKGKWWLVGASWNEDPLEYARQELSALPSLSDPNAVTAGHGQVAEEDDDDGEREPDLLSIARAHRMNTDVRRSIFIAIMSAADYRDAQVRLSKLHLKRAQEFEVPRVLIHCSMEEEAYNPYYSLIARRICVESGRRIKVSFAYTLWNVFKQMGEKGELDNDDDDDDYGDDDNGNEKLPMKAIVNLAKMYGSLVADGTLTLSFLKILNFAYLQPKTKMFVELLIITIIQQSQKKSKKEQKQKTKMDKKKNGDSKKSDGHGDFESGRDEKALMDIFLRTDDTPQIVKGLIFFIRKVVAKTDVVASGKDAKLVRWGCKVAVDALKAVSNAETEMI